MKKPGWSGSAGFDGLKEPDIEIRWGAAGGDGFENRSGANFLFVSTGSAED
ncbi:MAG: hypothetical protein H6Q99_3920 [Proteobacteria bacterium]|nr:hypothetical protein [Pseudomonadota bacterium]